MIKIGKKKISLKHQTYFIADIAANHDGSLNRAKKLIKLRSENRTKSNFDKATKRQGPARPDVGDPIFQKIIEYLRGQGINRENFREVFSTVREIRFEFINSNDKSKFKPSKKYIKKLKNSGLSDESIDRILDLIKAIVSLEK